MPKLGAPRHTVGLRGRGPCLTCSRSSDTQYYFKTSLTFMPSSVALASLSEICEFSDMMLWCGGWAVFQRSSTLECRGGCRELWRFKRCGYRYATRVLSANRDVAHWVNEIEVNVKA